MARSFVIRLATGLISLLLLAAVPSAHAASDGVAAVFLGSSTNDIAYRADSYGWPPSFEGNVCVEVYDAEGLLKPKDCRYFKGTYGGYPLRTAKCRKAGAGYTHATVEDLSGTKILDSDTAYGKCGEEADDPNDPGFPFVPPMIVPREQAADPLTCRATYKVTVAMDPSAATTLSMRFGDGTEERDQIPQGDGFVTVVFSHVFPTGTKSYVQRATIVETGRYSESVTHHL